MVRDVHALPPFVVEGFLGKRVVVDPAAPTPAAWRAEMSPPKRWPQYRLRATAGRQVRRRRVPDRSAQASPLPPKNQRPIGSGQSGDREPIAIRVPPLAPSRGRWALPTPSGTSAGAQHDLKMLALSVLRRAAPGPVANRIGRLLTGIITARWSRTKLGCRSSDDANGELRGGNSNESTSCFPTCRPSRPCRAACECHGGWSP